ncbi:MAG TPA: TonB family protein [Clostridia bacterium]|nr:TonB family protein [Clostridia bacterium]
MSSPGLFRSEREPYPPGREEPLDRWLDRLCQDAIRDMSASGAAVALRTGDVIVCRASAGDAPEVGVPVDLDQGICARCLRTAMLVVEQQLDSAVGSVAVSPVLRGTEAIGFFAVFATRKSAFLLDHITTVQESAAEIAARVERDEHPILDALTQALKPQAPVLGLHDQEPAPDVRDEPLILDFPTGAATPKFDAPVRGAAPGGVPDPLSPGFDPAPYETSQPAPHRTEPRNDVARSAAMELDELLAAAGFGSPRPAEPKPSKAALKNSAKQAPEPPPLQPAPEVLPLAADVPDGDEIMKIVREMDREVSRRSTATGWDRVDPAPRPANKNRKVLAAIALIGLVTLAGGIVVTRSLTQPNTATPATTTQQQQSAGADSGTVPAPAADAMTPAADNNQPTREPQRESSSTQPSSVTTKTAEEPIPVMPGFNPDLRRAGESEPEPVAPVAIAASTFRPPVIPSGNPAVPKLATPPPSESKPIDPPQLISRVTPVFPPMARTMKVSGKVVVALTVRPDGSVSKATIVDGNPIFHDSVLAAVRRWKYSPLPPDVTPVERVAEVTISFNK